MPHPSIEKKLRPTSPAATAVAAFLFALIFSFVTSQSTQAQTYTVIYNFQTNGGGENPTGLITDGAGTFYGTTAAYCGTVYRLQQRNSHWVFTLLYSFHDGYSSPSNGEGCNPQQLALSPDGTLYGSASQGGAYGQGIVFKLTPSEGASNSPWTKTVLHDFTGGDDGGNPDYLLFDRAANLYGTAGSGGPWGYGVLYEATVAGGQWQETLLHEFQLGIDGFGPEGFTFTPNGDIYGITSGSFSYYDLHGTVYRWKPSDLLRANLAWQQVTLYNFSGWDNGAYPYGAAVVDSADNVYATTAEGGTKGGGTVFELSPAAGAGWAYHELYSFQRYPGGLLGPNAGLVMDAAGNLYGTTEARGAGEGNVFELTHSESGWSYSSVHDFTGGADGAAPVAPVLFDANGNLFGTAAGGGSSHDCPGGCGVAFEIVP